MKMNRGKAQKDLLYISISFFITVAAWVAFNVYHAYVTSTISEELQTKSVPIDPSFDTATLESLKTRKNIQPVYTLSNSPSSPSAASSPQPQLGVSSQSAEPIQSNLEEDLGL